METCFSEVQFIPVISVPRKFKLSQESLSSEHSEPFRSGCLCPALRSLRPPLCTKTAWLRPTNSKPPLLPTRVSVIKESLS